MLQRQEGRRGGGGDELESFKNIELHGVSAAVYVYSYSKISNIMHTLLTTNLMVLCVLILMVLFYTQYLTHFG